MQSPAPPRRYAELVLYKTFAELKAEASGYFLGMLWWILEPALYLAAFYGIFRFGLRQGGDDFVPFLLVALVHWKWTASAITQSSNSIENARGLIQQLYLPKWLFPTFALANSSTKFLLTLALLFTLLATLGWLELAALAWLIPLYAVHLLLLWGVGALLAILVPFVRDLKPIIENGIIVMMLVSGIFFDIQAFPAEAQAVFYLNPIAVLMSAYRDLLLAGQAPALGDLGYIASFGIVATLAALWAHRRLDQQVAKVLI